MYETHFGLNKRPFKALATGSDVFVGPQTVAAMAGLKKALAAPDAVVAVSGPVGVGKTTIVRHALEAIGSNRVVISVGRMQLGHDEVLELLLEEMGVEELPSGTVQRFSAFRRLLKQHADDGERVFVIVEDAARLGADALSELEALTASDAGVSEGANIVLMGDEGLDDILKAPRIARLKQRLRLRQAISPLSTSELTGYFKHCLRLAGNEFDAVFETGCADVLHRISGGIPRIANNLVESSLISAVENKLELVNVAQIKLVAAEEYGLDTAPDAAADAVPTPPAEAPAPEKRAPAAPAAAEAPVEDEIPDLIQDTLPDLDVLAPELAKTPEAVHQTIEPGRDDVPEWERDPTLAQLRPDLDALEHAMAVAQGLEPDAEVEDDAKENSKSDEPAERVPEITLDRQIKAKVVKATEALKEVEEKRATVAAEKAAEEPEEDNRTTSEILADAKAKEAKTKDENSIEAQLQAAAMPTLAADAAPAVEKRQELASSDTLTELPILCEATIPAMAPDVDVPAASSEPRVEVAIALPEPVEIKELAAPTEPVQAEEPAQAEEPDEEALKADVELEKIATNLARAKTIDDCDDEMAETLFGEEFSMMAAEVAAMAPPELSANDDIENLDAEAEEEEAVAVPEFNGAAAVNVELDSRPRATGSNMDISASQRLATVRALNANSSAPPPTAAPASFVNSEPPPLPPAEQPDSIEDQINTSLTETLKTLSVRPPEVDNDDEDEQSTGFFGRFKRS